MLSDPCKVKVPSGKNFYLAAHAIQAMHPGSGQRTAMACGHEEESQAPGGNFSSSETTKAAFAGREPPGAKLGHADPGDE